MKNLFGKSINLLNLEIRKMLVRDLYGLYGFETCKIFSATEKTLRTMYTCIVEPHFRCCCSVWGCCGLNEINQLQKLQIRAASIVTGSRFDTPGLPLVKDLAERL